MNMKFLKILFFILKVLYAGKKPFLNRRGNRIGKTIVPFCSHSSSQRKLSCTDFQIFCIHGKHIMHNTIKFIINELSSIYSLQVTS